MILIQVSNILLIADVDERAVHDSNEGLCSPIRDVLRSDEVRCEVDQFIILIEGDGRLSLVDYHSLAKVTVLEGGVSDSDPCSSVLSEVGNEPIRSICNVLFYVILSSFYHSLLHDSIERSVSRRQRVISDTLLDKVVVLHLNKGCEVEEILEITVNQVECWRVSALTVHRCERVEVE